MGFAALLDRAVDQRRIEQPTIGTEGEGVLEELLLGVEQHVGFAGLWVDNYALNELDRMLAPIG